MSERGASRTALGVAALRGIHQLLDGEPKILDDPIAIRLLDEATIQAIRAGAAQAQSEDRRRLRSQVVLRGRYAEDRLALAVARGVGQCVILGAGLDTFACRQPVWARGLKIFEVDHQATQDDKRQRLLRAGIATPANLEFVAIDFEQVSLREGLRASTLDFSRPTFFSCLGVLVYLTQAAIDAIFELVAGFPAGSEIAFSFSSPRDSVSPLAASAALAGEPWRTQIEPAVLNVRLRAMGFSEVSFLERQEAEETYFAGGRADGLAAPRRTAIGAARVG
jgi:methyltransferase (TIGR00027 family)